ncbi:hypothetical protein GCM10010140_62600 [Streptosporangium pseudovulgare]|uniref:Uncharacterized protein n=1 Tax=Streptosporangium pseudovulgare TaxID=35765 RepID=A0ABQ2RBN9_9ACTN|nr:hypothetical protein GCM10010140_62600 [Streptosporangium pseudovulgare]
MKHNAYARIGTTPKYQTPWEGLGIEARDMPVRLLSVRPPGRLRDLIAAVSDDYRDKGVIARVTP